MRLAARNAIWLSPLSVESTRDGHMGDVFDVPAAYGKPQKEIDAETEANRRASLVVSSNAKDEDDRQNLLETLGLVKSPFPSGKPPKVH